MKKEIKALDVNEKIQINRGGAVVYSADYGVCITLDYSGAYGMGEKYNGLNQKGKAVINNVVEKFCFQGDKTYNSAPFFWTDSGFGLYVDTYKETTFVFGEDTIEVHCEKETELVLFSGSPKEIVSEYMGLFGKAVLPPDWSFGVWISANRWNSEKETLEQIEKLQKYDFPASVLVLEAWSDESTFYIWNGAKYTPKEKDEVLTLSDFDFSDGPWPDPAGMIKKLHDNGLKLILWQVPVYKKHNGGEKGTVQNANDEKYAIEHGYCVKMVDGTPYRIPEGHWFDGSLIPDFTNPAAKKSWFNKRKYLLDMGVDGFKTDGGEFVYEDDVIFADGSTGKEGKNRYAKDYTNAYKEFVGVDRNIFSRAGFSGQHLVPIYWAGDQQSQNEELSSVLSAGLSAAATGIPFWGFDIAGFAGPLPTLDLYRRATQLACFCPVMQWHSEPDGGQFKELMPGADGNNERSPWNMAESYNAPEFLDEMRYWHKLREKLIPYLIYTAKECVEKDMPMMRPLVYVYPLDEKAVRYEDEYLLGEDLLVAPLLKENATGRRVYIPQGTWVNLFTGEKYKGGSEYEIEAGNKIPVFYKEEHSGPIDELLKKMSLA